MTVGSPPPPPGWYNAPHANNELRYWDGSRWHDPARPEIAAESEPNGQPLGAYSMPAGRPELMGVKVQAAGQKRNGMAVAALVLGIIGAVFAFTPAAWLGILLGILALTFGLIAVNRPGHRRGVPLSGTILGGLALILGIVFAAVYAVAPHQSSPVAAVATEASQPPPPAETPTKAPIQSSPPAPGIPSDQQKFVDLMAQGAKDYESAKTDLQQSQAVLNRDAAVCAAFPSASFSNWVGKVKDVGANSEGKAYIEIDLGHGLSIQTWNNAFSDLDDNTLVPTDSPFFSRLVALTPGQEVVFSAQFVPDSVKSTCVKTANITEVFGAERPEVVVRFTDVNAK